MPMLATIFLILVAVVGWIVTCQIWDRNRIRKLAKFRLGESFETFRASFAIEEVAVEILLAVYAKFQSYSNGGFPVRADDCLWKIYRLDAEEFEDAINEVLAACHRQLPPNFRNLCPVIVNKVRDFVMVVDACPIKPTR